MIFAKDVKEMQKAQISSKCNVVFFDEAVENLLSFIEERIKAQVIEFPFENSIQLDFSKGIDGRVKDTLIGTIIDEAIKELNRLGFIAIRAENRKYWKDRVYRISW